MAKYQLEVGARTVDDAMSAWDTDNKYLFSLYQGETSAKSRAL